MHIGCTQENSGNRSSRCLIFGAPKGIRILIVLVTIGDCRYSLVRRNCGESQQPPTSTDRHHVFGRQIGHQIVVQSQPRRVDMGYDRSLSVPLAALLHTRDVRSLQERRTS